MPAHLLPVSRRQFIAGSAAAVVAIGQSSSSSDDSRPNPDCWAVLSDTHLLSTESVQRHYQGNKAAMEKRVSLVATNFERAARQVNALPEKPAGLIVNGDCVHVGGTEEYDLLARKFALIEEIPIHVTMGNHDHRDNFTGVFREKSATNERDLLEDRHVSVVRTPHANLVLLDSLTMRTPDRPVKGPGILGREQLDWVETVLDSESDKPALVMFHHNIDPSDDYQKRSGTANVIVESADPFRGLSGGLEDSDRLLAMLESKPHVKAVLSGHIHQFRIIKWRKLFFVSLPPVGYAFGPKEATGWLRMLLRDSGVTFEQQTLDKSDARHRKSVSLNWS